MNKRQKFITSRSGLVARQAHNPEVSVSNPGPKTKY